MKELTFTLLSDGSSDKTLLPLLEWLLRNNNVYLPIQTEWANVQQLPKLKEGLEAKIEAVLELYPCDLLFIHRDAEKELYNTRKKEILDALDAVINSGYQTPPCICVVPVKMQEAWFLFDEQAIRRAAGNPNGRIRLNLPSLKTIENQPDPKTELYEILAMASGLKGRRLSKFNPRVRVHRLAELIEDFSPLRQLSAFQALEYDIQTLIYEQNWNG